METLQAAASALLRQLIKHDVAQQDGEPLVGLHMTQTLLAKPVPFNAMQMLRPRHSYSPCPASRCQKVVGSGRGGSPSYMRLAPIAGQA